jgi:hypothetical protein
MMQPEYIPDESAMQYGTVIDYCKIFTEEMHCLYLLSFLLTADPDKAEQCFVRGLGACVEGIGVSTEWAHSWSRRTIFKNAIEMIMPAPERMDSVSLISFDSVAVIGFQGSPTSGKRNPFAAILALGAFERFVFIMSVLERQSDEDCSTLLACSRRDIMIARELALTRLAHSGDNCVLPERALQA